MGAGGSKRGTSTQTRPRTITPQCFRPVTPPSSRPRAAGPSGTPQCFRPVTHAGLSPVSPPVVSTGARSADRRDLLSTISSLSLREGLRSGLRPSVETTGGATCDSPDYPWGSGARTRSWLRPRSGRDRSNRASGDVVVMRQLSARRSAHRHQLQGRRRELDEQPDTKKHGRADRDVAQDVQQVMHRFLLDRPFHGSLAGGWHAGPAPAPLRLRTSRQPSGATAGRAAGRPPCPSPSRCLFAGIGYISLAPPGRRSQARRPA
jgi:hypothetical protein